MYVFTLRHKTTVIFSCHFHMGREEMILSISHRSSSLKHKFSKVKTFCSIWLAQLAPIITDVTGGFASSHAKAICERVWPRLFATAVNCLAASIRCNVTSWLHHFSAPSHSAYWKSMSYVKKLGGFGWRKQKMCTFVTCMYARNITDQVPQAWLLSAKLAANIRR